MWAPGPPASVIAAVNPPGGAGTGSPLIGLSTPVWSTNVPSLPSWSTRSHDVNPDSKPPLRINGIAFAAGAENATIDTHSSTWISVNLVMAVLQGIQRRRSSRFPVEAKSSDSNDQLLFRLGLSGGDFQ